MCDYNSLLWSTSTFDGFVGTEWLNVRYMCEWVCVFGIKYSGSYWLAVGNEVIIGCWDPESHLSRFSHELQIQQFERSYTYREEKKVIYCGTMKFRAFAGASSTKSGVSLPTSMFSTKHVYTKR